MYLILHLQNVPRFDIMRPPFIDQAIILDILIALEECKVDGLAQFFVQVLSGVFDSQRLPAIC